MPNWCQNRLTIELNGTSSEREQEILEMIEGFDKEGNVRLPISFATLLPEPDYGDPRVVEELGKREAQVYGKRGVMPAWWIWRTENWGTKWDACDVGEDHSAGMLQYAFDTAWSPPEPWILELYQRLLDHYPEVFVHYTYYEAGNGYAGYLKDGVLVEIDGAEELERIVSDEMFADYF